MVPFADPDAPLSGLEAALTKLGANLFPATKISFGNELAQLCAPTGASGA